jgi:hypothetical protein
MFQSFFAGLRKRHWDDKSQWEKGELVFALPGIALASVLGAGIFIAWLTGV